MRLFYNGRYIRPVSKDCAMKPKTSSKVVEKQLVAKYKFDKPALAIDMDSIMYQIPEPITFNNSGFIDTGIQLLKNDSDWTLFLDCIPNIKNKTQAVIHCVDENGSYPGISFSFENKGKINFYDGTSSTELGYGQYLNKNIKIVIVKKDNNIIVYHNYSSSLLYQPDYPIIIPYTFKSANTTLSIGGGHIGTSAIDTFSGVINNFVIYNKALEEQECESIMSDNPLPIFNNNFNYTIEDKYLDADNENIVTRSIYADTDFTSCSFEGETGLLTVEYLKVTNKVTTMDSMFYNCYKMTSVNANGWDTSNVTSMASTFGYCCHLEEIIGIKNWNTSSVEDLTDTFLCCCVGLTSVNLSGWDTSNVTSMYDTFQYCCSLEEIIGIENWNTSSVEDTTYMFMCCESLTTLNLSGWDTSNVYLPDEMFSDCTYLEELDISNWDLSNVDPYWLSYMFYLSELDSDTEYYDPDFKPYLKTIRCNNANTINKLINSLPTRPTNDKGVIICKNNSGVDTTSLAAKNWIIE